MNCPKIQQHLNLHQQIQFQQFVEFLDGLEVLRLRENRPKLLQNWIKRAIYQKFKKFENFFVSICPT